MPSPPQPQHAATRSPARGPALPVGLAVTAIGILLSIATAPVATSASDDPGMPEPSVVQEVPAVEVGAATAADPCAEPSVLEAISVADDAAIVAGFGGGEGFRAAVIAGNAPCISLDDPAHVWVVVNKARPLSPLGFAPSPLADIPLQMTTRSGQARSDVAAAVGEMAAAAESEGVRAHRSEQRLPVVRPAGRDPRLARALRRPGRCRRVLGTGGSQRASDRARARPRGVRLVVRSHRRRSARPRRATGSRRTPGSTASSCATSRSARGSPDTSRNPGTSATSVGELAAAYHAGRLSHARGVLRAARGPRLPALIARGCRSDGLVAASDNRGTQCHRLWDAFSQRAVVGVGEPA